MFSLTYTCMCLVPHRTGHTHCKTTAIIKQRETITRDVNDLIILLEKAKNYVFEPFLNVCGEVSMIWICLVFAIMNVERWNLFMNIYLCIGLDNRNKFYFIFQNPEKQHYFFCKLPWFDGTFSRVTKSELTRHI